MTRSAWPQPEELSMLFHTPASLGWTNLERAMFGQARKRKLVEGIILAQQPHWHMDFDVIKTHDGKCFEWDLYCHRPDDDIHEEHTRRLSKRVGWVEGFGSWLQDLYGKPLRLNVSCSASFVFDQKRFTNSLGLPRPVDQGFLGQEGVAGSLFSAGFEVEDERVRCSVAAGTQFDLQVGFHEKIDLAELVEAVASSGRNRSGRWVRELEKK